MTASCITAATLASDPASHSTPIKAATGSAARVGRAVPKYRQISLRQINQTEMGATTMPWAKVSERHQIAAIPATVSR